MQHSQDLHDRIVRLEGRLARTRTLAAGACMGLVTLLGLGLSSLPVQDAEDVIRTRGVEIVDDQGVVRLFLGQDSEDTQRQSRAVGLVLFDETGTERGGFTTTAEGSVVIGMDAPMGVGAPMRDRIGLVVGSDGSSYVMLIDNQTRGVAKLYSDGTGAGGVQVYKWDMEEKKVHVKTGTYDGETHETFEIGG